MIPAGVTYRCIVCGAELTLLRPAPEGFEPRCCNLDMDMIETRAIFYRCPVCGAEIAQIHAGSSEFTPRCCNTDMHRLAA